MKTSGKVVTTIFALLAFAASFLVVTADLDVYQPASKSSTTIHFVVQGSDSTRTIADRLQSLGLIRNALLFREYAHYVKKLDTKLEPGSYDLSASMTMDQIITTLLHGIPSVVNVCIPPGLRVTEYPLYFADHNLDSSDLCKSTLVPKFDANAFLTAVKSGVLPDDGKKASDDFWYVMPTQKNVAYPLEGYLFADTYQIDTSWDITQILRHLLATWGYQLCPGPSANPYQYIHDQTQCKAHAAPVLVGGKNISIFTAMEQQFFTTDDRLAFYDALTLSSIVVREAGQNPKDLPGIAAVYYNRYYVQQKDGNVSPVDNATIASFDADPTVWYAYYTDNPPKNGNWWADPQLGGGKLTDPKNPYNTYTNDGLPPGPIAAPLMADLTAVLQAPAPGQSSNFYFYHDNCGVAHYAQTQAQQDANVAKYQNAKCS
jgi:UPF0755 protein